VQIIHAYTRSSDHFFCFKNVHFRIFPFAGIEELENKLSDLEAKLSKSELTTTELTSSNQLLQEKLSIAEGRERITAQRLGQDLNKERLQSRSMGMQVDVLSKENTELTENSVKVSPVIYLRRPYYADFFFTVTN